MQNLTLLDLLECEATRDVTIRYVCGARKALYTSNIDLGRPSTLRISQEIERLYHSIGSEARGDAFANPRHNGTAAKEPTVPVAIAPTKPTKSLIPAEVCDVLVRDYINTDEEDEMQFTFGELVDFVCEAYLEDGKYEWDDHAKEELSGNARWYNAVSTSLQRMKAQGRVAHSKKRSCWVIL